MSQLAHWGLPCDGGVAETTAIVVAELAANAVTHGRVAGWDFELRLALSADTVRIEVSDARGGSRPAASSEIAPPAADAQSGRGLLLVQALSCAWGVAPRSVGKTVWAEVAVAGDPGG